METLAIMFVVTFITSFVATIRIGKKSLLTSLTVACGMGSLTLFMGIGTASPDNAFIVRVVLGGIWAILCIDGLRTFIKQGETSEQEGALDLQNN